MSSLPDVAGPMTREEVTDYLTDAAIPVRLACRRPSEDLWIVSLWYDYADGRLSCATGADSALAGFLRANDGVAVEVSENHPPYRGVRGSGTASIRPDEDKRLLRSLLNQYLGGTDSDLAASLLDPSREEVRIDVDLEDLYTWDFSDRMSETD